MTEGAVVKIKKIYGKLDMSFKNWHWQLGVRNYYTYDPDPSPSLIDWHAPMTDDMIAHIEELAAKYDPPALPNAHSESAPP